ncbi:MAG: dTDP-4-dehydrorhamnose reductase [Lachnospiraceae bacterium]|nr:dTDP-4-dehydrorhamnose reductase [Lachnospiraceae bacterium]
MKVLVTGVKGQLGFDVVKELDKRGHVSVGVDIEEMDITSEDEVQRVITETAPEAVIHCAAYTAVDKAEDEPDRCQRVNRDGTEHIAKACKSQDCKMLYISTDYVFSGEGETPWEPEDEKNPLSVYGRTKYEGELAVKAQLDKYFIVRITWAFGKNGGNFVDTMLRLGKERGKVSVVNDQIASPTYTKDLAVLLVDMIETEKYGEYHATNEGFCSCFEFAKEIFRAAGLDVEMTPVTTEEFGAKANRPKNSRLSKEKLVKNGFNKLPPWQNALERYLCQ